MKMESTINMFQNLESDYDNGFVLISEVDNPNNSRKFFRIPVNEYRDIISFNAFFSGKGKRNWNKKVLYYSHDYLSAKSELEYYSNESILMLDNIWEFYKMIGYNYKTKKYTR